MSVGTLAAPWNHVGTIFYGSFDMLVVSLTLQNRDVTDVKKIGLLELSTISIQQELIRDRDM